MSRANQHPRNNYAHSMEQNSCPTEKEFLQLLSGEMDKALESSVADHISTCVDCQLSIEKLSGGEEIQKLAEGDQPVQLEIQTLISGLIRQRRITAVGDVNSLLEPIDGDEFLGTLGDYQVIEVIGQGGMGVVFKARDPGLDRIVAIKTLLPAAQSNPKARERFRREAKNAAAVNHANVVTIHSVEVHNDMPFIVMEFVNGRSLQHDLESASLTELECLRISLQIAKALGSAHEQGLIHRDIKPANVLLINGIPRVKVTDFGLARAANDASITNPDAIAGTPNYMSPEQADAGAVDGQSDMFSLGCVMYRMFTGELAFSGESPLSVIRKVCDHDPISPRQLNADLPPWISDLILRLLSKDLAKRPTANNLVQLLERQLSQNASAPTKIAAPENEISLPKSPRQFWGVWFAAVAVMVLAFVLIANSFWKSDSGESSTKRKENQHQSSSESQAAKSQIATGQEAKDLLPFVLQGRRYDSLQEAIENAEDGETIVVEGNGPFSTSFISISDKSLTLQAAEGKRPVIYSEDKLGRILRTNNSLTLKGLVFQTDPEAMLQDVPAVRSQKSLLEVQGDRFSATDCGFISRETLRSLTLNCDDIRLTNCLLSPTGNSPCIQMSWRQGGNLEAENCIFGGRAALVVEMNSAEDFSESFKVSLRNTTVKGLCILGTMFSARPNLQNTKTPMMDVATENCLFDAEMVFSMKPAGRLRSTDVESYKKYLPRVVAWQDKKSFYADTIKPMVVRDRVRVMTVLTNEDMDYWRELNQIAGSDLMTGSIEFEQEGVSVLSEFTLKSTTPVVESLVGADIQRIPGE